MGEVIGTCGDKLRGVSDNLLTIKEHSQKSELCERVLCYVCVCDKCAKEYEEAGIVLHSEQEEQNWLNNK